MKMSIYLHSYVANALKMFGELDDVVNRILQAGADNKIEILNKPRCANRDGASRYDINITQEDYLQLLEVYSPNSSTISIRRLLYWFVDNEMYEVLDWNLTNAYVDKKQERARNYLQSIDGYLKKLTLLYKNNEQLKVLTSRVTRRLDDVREFLEI